MTDLRPVSLLPFVPSGSDYDASRRLFADLGFQELWKISGYAGFRNGERSSSCRDLCQSVRREPDDEVECAGSRRVVAGRLSFATRPEVPRVPHQPTERISLGRESTSSIWLGCPGTLARHDCPVWADPDFPIDPDPSRPEECRPRGRIMGDEEGLDEVDSAFGNRWRLDGRCGGRSRCRRAGERRRRRHRTVDNVENWPLPVHPTDGPGVRYLPCGPSRKIACSSSCAGEKPAMREVPARGDIKGRALGLLEGVRAQVDQQSRFDEHALMIFDRRGKLIDSWRMQKNLLTDGGAHRIQDQSLRSREARVAGRAPQPPDPEIHQRWIEARHAVGRKGRSRQ